MVLRAVLAAIVGTVIIAVGSSSLGETPKEATHAGPGSTTSSVPGLPLKETGQTLWYTGIGPVRADLPANNKLSPFDHWAERKAVAISASGATNYFLPEHDPLFAYIHDPGFVIPRPAPAPQAQVTAAALTEGEARAILTQAGWPLELHDQALAIIRCESNFRPDALGDGGRSAGLFQLNIATWFRYAGEDANLWHDPLVNARTALDVYWYDIGRGYVPWKQWSCRKVLN